MFTISQFIESGSSLPTVEIYDNVIINLSVSLGRSRRSIRTHWNETARRHLKKKSGKVYELWKELHASKIKETSVEPAKKDVSPDETADKDKDKDDYDDDDGDWGEELAP